MAKRETGFTLIELIIAISIIVILTGVVTPLVGTLIEEARVSRATSEVKVLAEAIVNLYKDTAIWPRDTTINTVTLWNDGNNGLLSRNTTRFSNAKAWRGPYVPKQIGTDPWNTPYHYNRGTISGVMSYGPNKTNNNSFNQRQAQQDDIVYYIQ